jgi:hypothetical protein
MAKVEGSNPFIRFTQTPRIPGGLKLLGPDGGTDAEVVPKVSPGTCRERTPPSLRQFASGTHNLAQSSGLIAAASSIARAAMADWAGERFGRGDRGRLLI